MAAHPAALRGTLYRQFTGILARVRYLFVPLFVHAPLGRGLEKFLSLLGKYSTGMWLVHSYFCYYLFHDFIYGFHYPALILVVLLLLSFSTAYVVQRISAFLTARIGL